MLICSSIRTRLIKKNLKALQYVSITEWNTHYTLLLCSSETKQSESHVQQGSRLIILTSQPRQLRLRCSPNDEPHSNNLR